MYVLQHRLYYGTGQICSIYNNSNDNQRQCFYFIKSLMRSYYTRAIMHKAVMRFYILCRIYIQPQDEVRCALSLLVRSSCGALLSNYVCSEITNKK